MGIAHRTLLAEGDHDLSAAFFRLLGVDRGRWVGALFLTDALGQPLEFVYNQIRVKYRFLWRERSLDVAVTRELLVSLLDLVPREPTALFFLAREVSPELFVEHMDILKPVARVATDEEAVGLAGIEEQEALPGRPGVQLFWVRGRPSDATPAHRLAVQLASRGLLLEPFERVLAGLRVAYELSGEQRE